MYHTHRLRFPHLLLASLTLLHLATPPRVHGDIYQWEWVDPSDHSKGKQQSTTLCPDGAGVDFSERNIIGYNLTQAYLIGIKSQTNYCSRLDLSNADLSQSNLTDSYWDETILTNANLTNANLTRVEFSNVTFFNAIFTDSQIEGTSFFHATAHGFTESQLRSASSYKTHYLTEITDPVFLTEKYP